MNEKTDQNDSPSTPIKSPLVTGLAALSVVLLIVVLIQSSKVSSLNEENTALSDRIAVLEEDLRVSQEALSALQQKEPNLFESLIGSMKEIVGEAEANMTDPNSDASSATDYQN